MNEPDDFETVDALQRLWGWRPSPPGGERRDVEKCSRPTPLNPRADDGVPSSELYRASRG